MFYWDIIVESAVMGRKRNITEGWKKNREEEKSPLNINKRQKKEKSARKEEILWQAIDIRVWVEWKKSLQRYLFILFGCRSLCENTKGPSPHAFSLRFASTVKKQCKKYHECESMNGIDDMKRFISKSFLFILFCFPLPLFSTQWSFESLFCVVSGYSLILWCFFHQHPPASHFSSGRCRAQNALKEKRIQRFICFFFPQPPSILNPIEAVKFESINSLFSHKTEENHQNQ